MYEEEFDAIVTAQRSLHADSLSDEHLALIRHAIFHQHSFEITEERRLRAPSRANLHRAPSARPCTLEPDQRCCSRAEWVAQQFRLLKEVNNLTVSEHYAPDRKLTVEERAIIIERLSVSRDMKFDRLRAALRPLGVDPNARFNLERGHRASLPGNEVDHLLVQGLDAGRRIRRTWAALSDEQKRRLRDALTQEEDDSKLTALLVEAGAPEEAAKKLAGWNPPDGYVGYSKRALERLLPFLEKGLSEYEAIEEAYPDRPESAAFERLPALASKDLPVDLRDITNPIVRRALVEVRKVVNAIVREHGRPARIVVELAREMKGGQEERKRYSKSISNRRRQRAEGGGEIDALGGSSRSRADVDRYLLWKEQGRVCVYTGDPIPQSELFRGGEWDVDHILPRWQSLDDSFANKVLARRSANQAKGNRTPAQWLGAMSQEFLQLVQRAEEMVQRTGMSPGKLSRLRQEIVAASDFAARQLNDTRYITKSVVRFLSLLYPPSMRVGEKAVQSCRGSLTAELRRYWGLLGLLEPLTDIEGRPIMSKEIDVDGQPRKSRADHRHHAIDAVVIAASSRAMLKRYQDHWRRLDGLSPHDPSRREIDLEAVPMPWLSMRDDTARHARSINVSHRAIRKIVGALHKETFLGQATENGRQLSSEYVTRMKLSDLTGSMVSQVRDRTIRQRVVERLRLRGWDGNSNAVPSDWYTDPELTTENAIPIRRVRIKLRRKNVVELGHRYAEPGSNHHLCVLGRHSDPLALAFEVATMMEVADRVRRRNQPMARREREDDLVPLMTLARKDSVLIEDRETGSSYLGVVQSISGPPAVGLDLVLRDARDSRPASEGSGTPLLRIRSARPWERYSFRKVQVDPLGRVFTSGD